MADPTSSNLLRARLRAVGYSADVIDAAWPEWWSDAANDSSAAKTDLHFSIARKLGLNPATLLDSENEPEFLWSDEAKFKHQSTQSARELAGINSFGRSVGQLLITGTPTQGFDVPSAKEGRSLLTNQAGGFIQLHHLLVFCWSLGIPVAQLRLFPWPQKRMAAMAVTAGSRHAILIGRNFQFPAPVMFYIAHELGHIALGHSREGSGIVDFSLLNREATGAQRRDAEELAADGFALELLTGNPGFRLFADRRPSAAQLADAVLRASGDLVIEPGALALSYAFESGEWGTANRALQLVYDEPRPVWRTVNTWAFDQLDASAVPADGAHFLSAVLGRSALR